MKSPEGYNPLTKQEIIDSYGDGSVVYVETEVDVQTHEPKFQIVASSGPIDKFNQGDLNKPLFESSYFEWIMGQPTDEFDVMWHEDIKTK